MSYNGSGTFQINTSGQPIVAGTVISSTAFNALTADLATGLSTAITKDGQTTTTARIPFAQGISSTLTTDSSSVSTGSILTAGGLGVAKAAYVGTTLNVGGASTFTGAIAVDSVTDSTSTTTGSIQTDGGVGIAKALYVGTTANIAGTTNLAGLTASSAVATDASKNLVSVTNTGTGNNVLATSPTLVTPILGTPQSGTLTNCTGLPTTALTGAITEANGGTGTTTGYYGFKNRIINGGMGIAQRGTSFTSGANDDDAYVLDRFYILSDGNDAIDVTQTTTVPTGAKYSIGLDVETANKKFGIAQIIENANCFDVIGGNVTLSFQAKVSSTTKLDNVKCAIVAWSGTADTVTSDIISAWGAEGTNPTLIANATYENTPANLNVTTSFATYSVTANVDTASTSNIIVFIWSDVTDTTAGDFLYITNVQLEKGSTATSFDYRPYGTELLLCQRYYYRTTSLPLGYILNAADFYAGSVKFPVTMRTTATLDASGNSYAVTGGSAGTVGLRSGTGFGPSTDQCVVYNASSNWSAGNAGALTAGFSAEL
jgi:hypothetical protein